MKKDLKTMLEQRKKIQTFNDGYARFYHINNIGESGLRPEKKPILYISIDFEERTVGVKRLYEAKRTGTLIERVIRCYAINTKPTDIVEIEGEQYRIEQIQIISDVVPRIMDVALERLDDIYEITINKSEGSVINCNE